MRDIVTCFSCKLFGTTCDGYTEICTFVPRENMSEEERHERLDDWLKGSNRKC